MAQNESEIRYLTPPTVDVKKKKYCRFRKARIKFIDYKDPEFLKAPDRALAKLILIESNGKRTLDEQCDSLGVFLLYKMQIIIERNHRGKYGESI